MARRLVAAFLIVLVSSSSAIAGTVQLPKTGQTTSYAPGDDGDLQKGIPWAQWPDARFVDHGDGTVTDTFTGLMWTKNNLTYGFWGASLEYIKGMNNGSNSNFGHTDWRLPNINEIESLVDYGVATSPRLPSHHPFEFATDECSWFWTSTTQSSYHTNAWVFNLYSGYATYTNKESQIGCWYSTTYVRTIAVRTTSLP